MSLTEPIQDIQRDLREEPLLSVESLSVNFTLPNGEKVRPVSGINLEIRAGEIVCLVGESGCGKSVTVRSIFGLVPSPGKVTVKKISFDGQEVTNISAGKLRALCRHGVGYVFQDPMTYLNPLITVGGQVAESITGKATIVPGSKTLKKIVKLFADLGIPDPSRVAFSYPHQLSGGMRQRVMVAMAMARSPKLLILDEPTTALDVTVQAQIVDLIKDIRRNFDVAVLLVTHDFGLVAELAERVYVMYAGEIVEYGKVKDLFEKPQHPYTRGLIDCVTSIFSGGGKMRYISGEVPNPRKPIAGCRFYPRCSSSVPKCQEMPPVPVYSEDGFARCWLAGEKIQSPATEVNFSSIDERASSSTHAFAATKLLVVDNVVQNYPVKGGAFGDSKAIVHAVNGVSLKIPDGQIWALVGESGSGKSTLARMVAGLETPKQGKVYVGEGEASDWTKKQRGRSHAQMVFQDPYSSLNPRKKVRYFLTQPLINFGLRKKQEVGERLKELLEAVGLMPPEEYLERYPHELSGGQRQRVVLARALAAEPRLLIADEPVSSLDISTRAQILGLLKEFQNTQQLSVLLITHDLAVVKSVADKVGVMYLGRLLEIGNSMEVIENPKHPYAEALIAAVPVPDPSRERPSLGRMLIGEPPSPVSLPKGCTFHPRCPKATEVCRKDVPDWRKVGENHLVACHLFDTLPRDKD